ncbi:serine/threonine-protein kinase 31 [Chanos chanos]|uniref:Serine/threonine-protein kinase 31 n=1 Tax=Chanos chanos TaxID=29144 RepID=A0A6J2WV68_CHACN|nr:serine/threonine-protein kinase 31 [Chanos chanos]
MFVELVIVTHVMDAITFWAQNVTDDSAVEKMANLLSEKCPTSLNLFGRPDPQKLYGALFSADHCWHRCKVQQQSANNFLVSSVDYGNVEIVSRSNLVELPEDLQSAALAKKYKFWGFHVSSEQDSSHFLQGKSFLQNLILGRKLRIYKKSVCFDGTIQVQAFQGNLNIGEEVLKLKFAKVSLPGSRPFSPPVQKDPPRLWLHKGVDGCPEVDKDITSALDRMPKLRPAFSDHSQPIKEKNSFVSVQSAGSALKKNVALVKQPDLMCLEEDVQQLFSMVTEQELSQTQRVREEVGEKTKQIEKMSEENRALKQHIDYLENQVKEAREELKTEKQECQRKIALMDKHLEKVVGDTFSRLAEKVDSLRRVRERNPCTTAEDKLLESITFVVNDRVISPLTTEKLDLAWEEYSQAQEKLRTFQAENAAIVMEKQSVYKEDLEDLVNSRNGLHGVLLAVMDEFLLEVEELPVNQRIESLAEAGSSLTALFGSFSMEDVGGKVFEQFLDWKRKKYQISSNIHQATDHTLNTLCSWASNISKFFCLTDKTPLALKDLPEEVDNLLKQVELDLSKELDYTLKEQDDQRGDVVFQAFSKVMQLIEKEKSVLFGIREKCSQIALFKKEASLWESGTPKADRLHSVKQRIKTLHLQLRWKLVEEGCLQEAEELDLPEILRKKEEIAETRSALFQEISREKEEYRRLSDLVKGMFPELPLLYPDVDINSYMCSDGLLLKSLDREMFDAEPMKDLSRRRPLVCTEFLGQKVVLKGYSVDEESEVKMLEQAKQFHIAQSQEPSSLSPLLALFFGKSDPLVYVMVPHFSNGSLRAVQRASPLTHSEAGKVMRGVAVGLQSLHAFNITHGSLHPNNVFVLNREQGIVGEYDFTKTPEQRAADSCMVAGGISLVAPELFHGLTPTSASDMYAFGCLLLWLHVPDFGRPVDSNIQIEDLNGLQLDGKLQSLLTKLLVGSGRLSAPETLMDKYFLSFEA